MAPGGGHEPVDPSGRLVPVPVATVAPRRGAYLSLVLLVGLVGGVAMGAIAAGPAHPVVFPGLPGQHQSL